MSSKVQLKKRKSGGLHLNLAVGDKVYIWHNNEMLEMTFHGRNGANQHSISFNGDKNFLILRNNSRPRDNQNEVQCEKG